MSLPTNKEGDEFLAILILELLDDLRVCYKIERMFENEPEAMIIILLVTKKTNCYESCDTYDIYTIGIVLSSSVVI
jgi:hypothetical protein